MYAYLEGALASCDLTSAVIDCGGVGYLCNITEATYSEIAGKPRVRLYTHLQVKEDGMTLFGFADEKEKETFLTLTSVSGVGPKAAISVLSQLTPESLASAVAAGDYRKISQANGIGAKLAQRICLELKDKLAKVSVGTSAVETLASREVTEEALSVLVALGYTRADSDAALAKCTADNVNDLVRQALRFLTGLC